jgi:hypothetical protein
MPLQDHFHPPLSLRRHWHAFHNSWATYISSDLNRRLPRRYFAEAKVQFNIEIDVATFEEPDQSDDASNPWEEWSLPSPTQIIPFALATDVVEIRIFSTEEGPELAGAIELVSPANKDRRAHRDAFVSKCAAYLHQGAGLMIVDVVTDRSGDLHQELLNRVSPQQGTEIVADLYATAYQPAAQNGEVQLRIWREFLAVSRSLPTMPLFLRGGLCLPVDLEAAYQRTCEEQRVSLNGGVSG